MGQIYRVREDGPLFGPMQELPEGYQERMSRLQRGYPERADEVAQVLNLLADRATGGIDTVGNRAAADYYASQYLSMDPKLSNTPEYIRAAASYDNLWATESLARQALLESQTPGPQRGAIDALWALQEAEINPYRV